MQCMQCSHCWFSKPCIGLVVGSHSSNCVCLSFRIPKFVCLTLDQLSFKVIFQTESPSQFLVNRSNARQYKADRIAGKLIAANCDASFKTMRLNQSDLKESNTWKRSALLPIFHPRKALEQQHFAPFDLFAYWVVSSKFDLCYQLSGRLPLVHFLLPRIFSWRISGFSGIPLRRSSTRVKLCLWLFSKI